MEGSQALQLGMGGPIAGSSAALPALVMPQVHGAAANNGDVNTAGRDVNVNVHNHYNSYPDKVDIGAVLGAIRNLRTIHQDIISKATPGTGIWFFKTNEFLVWVDLDGDIKILWGTGIPGAGKTVLASIVIQELEARAEAAHVQICVCYVFIRYSDSANLTVRDVLEILVKQTVERHPNCAALAEVAYARHVREKTQPNEAELLKLLHQFTETVAATFYLLDALDEAPDRIQASLVQKLATLNIRLFITSRPLDTVQARVPNSHCFPIVAQEGDLDIHIAQEIARSPNLATLLEEAGSSLQEEIVSLIKRKCAGMFLHASLQLDALTECINARGVRQMLEAFPSRIEDVYYQTWHRIQQNADHASTAKALLIWVLNAARPMRIVELQRAVAISPETCKFEADRLVPETTLIALCRGLVTLEEESRIVRLVHYTAKDMLQGLLKDSFPHPQSHLVTVCMSHLAACGFQNTAIRSREEFFVARRADPLLEYASEKWATHARKSLDDKETKRRTAIFVKRSNAFPAFINPKHCWDFDILSPFHVLALYNLHISLIPPHHIGDPNVASQINGQRPLELAIWHGHEVAAMSLLAHPKIQVNFWDHQSQSALILALKNGQEGIAKLLLAHPDIQVNFLDREGWSALMWAARKGQESVAKLLLARPETLVNLSRDYRASALSNAARYGHEGIVKLLLACPEIQVNLLRHYHQSALILSLKNGHEGITELLLAHPKIQVNPENYAPSTDTERSDEGMPKLYLLPTEIPVNYNPMDDTDWSALMWAASKGQENVAKLLLALPGTLVNLVDSFAGLSALMRAASCGHEGIIRLLLAHPETQVNLVCNRRGLSALMLATQEGHEGIVRLLLARSETLVNLVDAYPWSSALMLAAQAGHEGVIKLLLAHPEIQINLVDYKGFSALTKAARYGHETILKLLLASPEIQVNPVNKEVPSALILAARYGHEGAVRLLLACPQIQVNLVDNQGVSALMEAARYGHEAILKLLLESSEIQVNPVDKEVPSALILAARYGREGAVRLLLACPDIQVNLVDNQGVSALMEAARVGHDGVVRLLLSHPDTLLGSIDKKKWSALRLPIPIKWETSGGLRLAVLPHVDAASRRAAEGHAAMSLALVGGHMGIVQLLEQFDSRKASLHSADLTLKDVGRLDHLESGEPINEESESERDSEERQVIEEWLIGDGTMDMDTGNAYCLAADYDGADNLPPDEPSDSRRGVKRSRGEEDVNSQSPVDYMAAPASKRHRGEAVEEDP